MKSIFKIQKICIELKLQMMVDKQYRYTGTWYQSSTCSKSENDEESRNPGNDNNKKHV